MSINTGFNILRLFVSVARVCVKAALHNQKVEKSRRSVVAVSGTRKIDLPLKTCALTIVSSQDSRTQMCCVPPKSFFVAVQGAISSVDGPPAQPDRPRSSVWRKMAERSGRPLVVCMYATLGHPLSPSFPLYLSVRPPWVHSSRSAPSSLDWTPPGYPDIVWLI